MRRVELAHRVRQHRLIDLQRGHDESGARGRDRLCAVVDGQDRDVVHDACDQVVRLEQRGHELAVQPAERRLRLLGQLDEGQRSLQRLVARRLLLVGVVRRQLTRVLDTVLDYKIMKKYKESALHHCMMHH